MPAGEMWTELFLSEHVVASWMFGVEFDFCCFFPGDVLSVPSIEYDVFEEFSVDGVGWSDGGLFLSLEPKSGEKSRSISTTIPVGVSAPN